MAKSLPLRVYPALLRELRKRAKSQNGTVSDYAETVLRRDLARKPRAQVKPMIELRGAVPAKAGDWTSERVRGEPERKRKAREKLVRRFLDLGGVPRRHRPIEEKPCHRKGQILNIASMLSP